MGEKVPQTYRNSVNMAALGVDGVLPSPGNRRRALTSTRREGENGERERRENKMECTGQDRTRKNQLLSGVKLRRHDWQSSAQHELKLPQKLVFHHSFHSFHS